jgi:two-component system, response regulator PdtaR
LKNGRCPSLIYSGYGEAPDLLAEFHSVTWIEKPVPPSALVQACQELLVNHD